MALNKWIGIGRLTKSPELKTTQGGLSVCSFTIAVDRGYQKGEEREADFINVVAWRSSAEFLCKYFDKGDPVQIVGSLQTRTWDDAQGVKHFATEVVADTINFVEGYRRQEQAIPNPNFQPPNNEFDDDLSKEFDDDLPF